MLALGVAMVSHIISITTQTTRIEERLDNLNSSNIHSLVGELRDLNDKDNDPYYRVLLFMLLLQEAWYYPEESVAPLSEAFKSGEGIYWDFERAREMVGPELAFAYLYAGLPAQLDEWQAQVVIQEPHKRYRLRFLQAAGKLLSDDRLAARQLVEKELEVGATTPRGKAFALVCYMLLEDYNAAQALGLGAETIAIFDLNQQLAYAELLMFNGDYLAAVEQYRSLVEHSDFSPERHFELAVPMAALSGIGHPQVQAELAIATGSTRRPTSLAGTEAVVISELLRYSVAGNWEYDLAQLALDHPADFWVQAALLDSKLQATRQSTSTTGDAALQSTPTPLAVTASGLLELAQTKHEQQWANLLLATTAAYGYRSDPTANPAGLDNSLMFLKRALGDPHTDGSVESNRMPDYEMFVLDPVINHLRNTDQGYNAGINHAIVDYLRRIQERYADVVDTKQLEYRIP